MKSVAMAAFLVLSSVADGGDGGEAVDAGLVVSSVDTDGGVASDTGFVVDAGVVDAGVAGQLVNGFDVDIVGLVKKASETGHSTNWTVLFVLSSIIVVLTSIARKIGGQFIPFLKTDRGGALLVLLLSVFGGLVNTLAAKTSVSLSVVVEGMGVGLMSAGGFNLLKKLFFPSDSSKS